MDLIYYTHDYHKLVEVVARQCYQSFEKVDNNSHKFIRSIMSKGHLSVATAGNIVFGLKTDDVETLRCLMKMKEVNNFIRWTFSEEGDKYKLIVSMNMVTFLDIKANFNSDDCPNYLFNDMLALTDMEPTLSWFYNRDIEIEPSKNTYTEMSKPLLYHPVLLSEDYSELKALGLNEHELDIHATVTISFMTDRSVGLQFWRHTDMTGGTELSQRYVNRAEATFRGLIGFEDNPKVNDMILSSHSNYNTLYTELTSAGVHQGRAKEVARSVLPNAITTEIIQCRPLRQWKHFFDLRVSCHAQKEAEADAVSIKNLFVENQIEV